MLFYIVITIVIIQRLVELIIAKRNEKWMRSQGAFEAGAGHYPIMVSMHIAFFISLILEVSSYRQAAFTTLDPASYFILDCTNCPGLVLNFPG